MLKQTALKINNNSNDLGFWDNVKPNTKLMIVISELSESLDAYRIDNYCDLGLLECLYEEMDSSDDSWYTDYKIHVYNTVEETLVDAYMVLLDYVVAMDLDFKIIESFFDKFKSPKFNQYTYEYPDYLLRLSMLITDTYYFLENGDEDKFHRQIGKFLGSINYFINSNDFDIMKMIECKLFYNTKIKPLENKKY